MWMRFVVGFTHSLRADVRVDLRRRQTLVAEQLLDATKVRSTVEHVGRECVTQRMRASLRIETVRLHVLL